MEYRLIKPSIRFTIFFRSYFPLSASIFSRPKKAGKRISASIGARHPANIHHLSPMNSSTDTIYRVSTFRHTRISTNISLQRRPKGPLKTSKTFILRWNLTADCGNLSAGDENSLQFAGSFQPLMKPSRNLRQAFSRWWKFPAVCGELSANDGP